MKRIIPIWVLFWCFGMSAFGGAYLVLHNDGDGYYGPGWQDTGGANHRGSGIAPGNTTTTGPFPANWWLGYCDGNNQYTFTHEITSSEANSGAYIDVYVSGYTPPANTNLCLTVNNTSTTTFALATWYWDGAPYAQQYLYPGESYEECSPSFPMDQNHTFSSTLSWPNNNPYSAFTNSIDQPLTINFTNQFSGAGGSTNWTPPDPTVNWFPNTNNIIWAATDGTGAQEATLKSGIGQLHDDMQKQIADFNQMIEQLNGWKPPTNFSISTTVSNQISVITTNMTSFSATNFVDLSGLTNSLSLQTAAVTNALGQVGLFMRTNNDQMWQLVGIMTNGFGDVTNALAHLTNSVGMTNYATESTLQGVSNQLSSLGAVTNGLAYLTNLLGAAVTNLSAGGAAYSNWFSQVAGMLPSSATNASAAETAANAAQGDYGVQGLIDQLVPSLPPDSVPAPDMTMQFCGRTIDLDPVHMFPSVASVSLIGFRIVLILAFLAAVANMFWQMVGFRAAVQTGGVPNLNVQAMAEFLGCGGSLGANVLGVLVALAVPFAFIVLFAVSMSYLFSHIGVSVAEAMGFSTFSNGLGNIGYYLLSSYFPVSLACSLATTRLVLQFTLGKLVALGSAAARFLWGK